MLLLQTPYQPSFSTGLAAIGEGDGEMSWIQGFRAVRACFRLRVAISDNRWTSVRWRSLSGRVPLTVGRPACWAAILGTRNPVPAREGKRRALNLRW